MTFAQALSCFTQSRASRCVITRPDGPIFDIDENGQMRMRNDCLYVGDFDFDDWVFAECTCPLCGTELDATETPGEMACQNEDCSGPGARKPVAVTHESGDVITVLARFDTITIQEAETFLDTSPMINRDDLHAGNYGIDAPEEMVNPPLQQIATASKLLISAQEAFDVLQELLRTTADNDQADMIDTVCQRLHEAILSVKS